MKQDDIVDRRKWGVPVLMCIICCLDSFQEMRKVIVVDDTFLRRKYGGVLLSTVAKDAENHIFSVAFCVVDKECDASYEYFFKI